MTQTVDKKGKKNISLYFYKIRKHGVKIIKKKDERLKYD